MLNSIQLDIIAAVMFADRSPPSCFSSKSSHVPRTSSLIPLTVVTIEPPHACIVRLRSSSTTRPAQNMSLQQQQQQPLVTTTTTTTTTTYTLQVIFNNTNGTEHVPKTTSTTATITAYTLQVFRSSNSGYCMHAFRTHDQPWHNYTLSETNALLSWRTASQKSVHHAVRNLRKSKISKKC